MQNNFQTEKLLFSLIEHIGIKVDHVQCVRALVARMFIKIQEYSGIILERFNTFEHNLEKRDTLLS